MAENFKDEVFRRAPYVNIVCGPRNISRVTALVRKALEEGGRYLAVEGKEGTRASASGGHKGTKTKEEEKGSGQRLVVRGQRTVRGQLTVPGQICAYVTIIEGVIIFALTALCLMCGAGNGAGLWGKLLKR